MVKNGISKLALAIGLAASLGLGACAQNGSGGVGTKTAVGAAAGAAGGGLIGSALGGGTEGIVAGVLLGGAAGNYMDQQDRQYASQTTTTSLENAPTGQATTWRNPDSGHYGTVTPTRTYQNDAGLYYREFSQTVYIDGRAEAAHGTACRQPDGTWEVVA
jgi:surface antigen